MKEIDLARIYKSSGNFPGLFGDQFKALLRRGFQKAEGKDPTEFLRAGVVLGKIAQKHEDETSKKRGIAKIPFLIVSRSISLREQLLMVAGMKKAELKFDEKLLCEDWGGALEPQGWYLAIDVQLNPRLLDTSPEEAALLFKEQGRFPLNVFEGAALALHYRFGGITVTLPGSSVEEKRVPYIYSNSEEIVMGATVPGMHFGSWLSASCGMRISVATNE